MGLGKAFRSRSADGQQNRSTVITSTDTLSGATQTFTVYDNIAPSWATASGYQGGMGIPGPWRAANLIAGLLGQMPYDAFRDYGDSSDEKITPRPMLLEQPNPPETRMNTFSSGALDLIWHGNMFAIIGARNYAGYPISLIPIPASGVAVRRVGQADVGYNSPFPAGTIEYQVGTARYADWQVLHVKGPCAPGELRGMGVLEAQWETLELATALQHQAKKIANHGVPTGVLQSDDEDMTADEALALKARWTAQTANGGVAVLNPHTSFQPLAWDPEKMQLVEARKMSLGECELVFGLPVGWLGGATSARQYSNIEQDAINLLKFTLGEHVARIEQALSLLFPRGTAVHGNLDFILRSDTLSRYQAHAIGLDKGFLTLDEVRGMEHRPPLPEPEITPPPIQAQSTVGNAQQTLPGNPAGTIDQED